MTAEPLPRAPKAPWDDNPTGYRVLKRGVSARQPQLETSGTMEKMAFKKKHRPSLSDHNATSPGALHALT